SSSSSSSSKTHAKGWKKSLLNFSYVSFDFVSYSELYVYAGIGGGGAALALLVFMLLFFMEVRRYGILRYLDGRRDDARNQYFHSFVGTIIYGHGYLKSVNSSISMIMRILCDTFFLSVCDKLIMLLCCTDDGYLRIDESIVCWKDRHLKIGTCALILLAYYIPFSVMVAPMLVENENDNNNSTDGVAYYSLTSTIEFIKPYLSVVTLSKSFMLISTQLISQGKIVGTVVSQLIACVSLFAITMLWSWNNLNVEKYSSVNKPSFPYGVNIIKAIAFLAGAVGCVIELLFYYGKLPHAFGIIHFDANNADVELLLFFVLLAALAAFLYFIFLRLEVRQYLKPLRFQSQDSTINISSNQSLSMIAFDAITNNWFWS
ncbi:hypothetical protein RFI_33164, partial [Reticulomyxa filosa]